MANSTTKWFVSVSGAPQECNLKEVKDSILEALGKDNKSGAVEKIQKCKSSSGEVIPGKFEVELAYEEDQQKLMEQVVVDIEHGDSIHLMKITIPRQSSLLEDAKASTPKQSLPDHPAKAEPFTDDSDEERKKEKAQAKGESGKKLEGQKLESPSSTESSNNSSSDEDAVDQLKVSPTSLGEVSSQRKSISTTDEGPSVSGGNNPQRMSHQLTNWFEILQNHPKIFQSHQKSCIVVRSKSDQVSEKQLYKQFGGSSIMNIFYIKEGFLLVYKKSSVARKFTSEEINGFVVFPKPVPPVYKDRILLKGNFSKTFTEEVREVLECCTEVTFQVKKLRESDWILVVFEKEIDIAKLAKDVKKLPLEDIKPQVIKICRSDCVKVQNVNEKANHDAIRMALMNKKYGGGKVTSVDRRTVNIKVAIVYFASYEDAESLIQKSKEKEILIKSSPVEVSLFCPGINSSVEFSSDNIYQFHFDLDDVDNDVVKFVKLSKEYSRNFHKDLGDLADVDIIEDSTGKVFTVKVKPLSKDPRGDIDQEQFENDCTAKIRRFFSKFATESRHFEEHDRDRVREANRWNDQEIYVEKKINDKEVVKVFVRWELKTGDGIKVVGVKKQAKSFLTWFEQQCSYTEESKEYDPDDFYILLNCGIIEEVKHFVDESVDVCIIEEKRTVRFSGSRERVKMAVSAVEKTLKRVIECSTKFLHDPQKEFLRRSLERDSSSHSGIIEFIQEKFKQSSIKVALVRKGGELKLKYDSTKSNELERAQTEMKNLLKFQNIPFKDNFDELIQEEEWKSIKSKIELNGKLCVLENKHDSSVTLVGLPSTFNTNLEHIMTYMENNAEVEEKAELTYSKATFFSSFSSEIDGDSHLANVEWCVKPGGICVKGRACIVRKAVKWIMHTANSITTKSHCFTRPGVARYLRGDNAKQFLSDTSKNSICFIHFDWSEPQEWINERMSNKSETESQGQDELVEVTKLQEKSKPGIISAATAVASAAASAAVKVRRRFFGNSDIALAPEFVLQLSSVRIAVVPGVDILQSRCDVMVNTIGDQFDLTCNLSKVSSALIQKAGKDLVEECAENPLIRKKMLRVTKAPNLTFKRIIHLVTPNTPEKIAENLLEAFKTVEEDLQLSSLAIPAIGTGHSGLSDVEVAKSIRRAIDLFTKNKPKMLKKIDVVVYEKRMIDTFKTSILGSKPAESSRSTTEQGATSTNVLGIQPQPASTSTASSSLITNATNVTVSSGDILKANAEVLVNTVASDFNLLASQLSKLVLQIAGRGLQKECQSNPIHKAAFGRITTGGTSQFKNIVHFITANNYQAITKSLYEMLNFVDKTMKSQSIALPAIGTGNAGLNSVDVAKAFGSAIDKFVAGNPSYLTRIEVVIFQQNLLADFQAHINTAPPVAHINTAPPVAHINTAPPVAHINTAPPVANMGSSVDEPKPRAKPRILTSSRGNKDKYNITLHFTSNNTNNIEKAISKVRAKAELKCLTKPIKEDVLELLDEEGLDELKTLETKFHVCLNTIEDESKKITLEIEGLKSDVNEAFSAAIILLKDYSKAVTCADYVTWKYVDQNTKQWVQHGLMNNYELESAYKEDISVSYKIKMKDNGVNKEFNVDFKKMSQNCPGKQTESRIKRFDLSGDSFPDTWDSSKSRQLVTLTSQSHPEEYERVIQAFQSNIGNAYENTGTSMTVIQVDRVENKRLYMQFLAQKKEVEERIKGPATRGLFHGTTKDVCEQIYKGGFNRSYAGRNAVRYGKGVYFATTSEYSHRYAQPNSQGERRMFLADVITGEYVQGDPTMIDAPPRPGGSTADVYDSVVNNPQSPSIFVVFKDASVYPLYVLTYK